MTSHDGSDGVWRAAVFDRLHAMYLNDKEYHAGHEDGVTQLEHALQAANIAARCGAPNYAIIAALLHDVGWKLPSPAGPGPMFVMTKKSAEHDTLGAAFLLECGFDPRVATLVGGHVAAKRYLCWKDPTYEAGLSANSTATLAQQGGPMTATEAAAFETQPLFSTCIALRMWDDQAKIPRADVPPFTAYRDAVAATLGAA